MNDFQQEEQKIMQQVTDKLSHHDYIRKLRAQLKILTYDTAQKMVENQELPETEQMKRIDISDQKDKLILALIADLFQSCGLENSAKMLQRESSSDLSQIDLNTKYPQATSPFLVECVNK